MARKLPELGQELATLVGAVPARPVRLWVLDEHRYGLLPVIRRVWGLRGALLLARYATKYKWGYLHEALEMDGAHASEFLFTRRSIAISMRSSSNRSPTPIPPPALHVVIQDQAGFHLPTDHPRLPANLACFRCFPTATNSIRSNASAASSRPRFYPLRKLEDHLFAVYRTWTRPANVAVLLYHWLADQVNSGAPA